MRKKLKFAVWSSGYEAGYRKYALMRGFATFNDFQFHWRGFVLCWGEPGFHRFWQVWNPGISYLVYLLFLELGGRRRWFVPTVLSFSICGIVHTLIVFPFLGWSFSLIFAFTFFGLLTVVSRVCARKLRQDKWPGVINVLVNTVLIAACFDLGFRLDRLLM